MINLFLQQHQETLFAPRVPLTPQQLALAALSLLCVEASHNTTNDAGTYCILDNAHHKCLLLYHTSILTFHSIRM